MSNSSELTIFIDEGLHDDRSEEGEGVHGNDLKIPVRHRLALFEVQSGEIPACMGPLHCRLASWSWRSFVIEAPIQEWHSTERTLKFCFLHTE
jgi:hypothetical protein